MIYFITAEGSDLIKIGVTNNLGRRLTELMCCGLGDLNVIQTFDGDRKVESAVHRAMSGWRRRGQEWFDGDAARAFIADAEASSLTSAIELWQSRNDERNTQSRKACQESAAKFITAFNGVFDALIDARGEDAVRSLLKMPPGRFAKRKFQSGDDLNVYLLSEEPQQEALRAAWGELCGGVVVPLPSVLNADSAKPAETPREKVERLQRELFNAIEDLVA